VARIRRLDRALTPGAGPALVRVPGELRCPEGFVAPVVPAEPGAASEHLQVRTGAHGLDEIEKCLGLLRVATTGPLEPILRGARQRGEGAPAAEQHELGCAAERAPEGTSVRRLAPDQRLADDEAPRLRDFVCVAQIAVRRPEVEMRIALSHVAHGEGTDRFCGHLRVRQERLPNGVAVNRAPVPLEAVTSRAVCPRRVGDDGSVTGHEW
jgi:hypothetical protein